MRHSSTGRNRPNLNVPPAPSNAPTLVRLFQPLGGLAASVGSGAPCATRSCHLRLAQSAGCSLVFACVLIPVNVAVPLLSTYSSLSSNRLCPHSCAMTTQPPARVKKALPGPTELQPPHVFEFTITITWSA